MPAVGLAGCQGQAEGLRIPPLGHVLGPRPLWPAAIVRPNGLLERSAYPMIAPESRCSNRQVYSPQWDNIFSGSGLAVSFPPLLIGPFQLPAKRPDLGAKKRHSHLTQTASVL